MTLSFSFSCTRHSASFSAATVRNFEYKRPNAALIERKFCGLIGGSTSLLGCLVLVCFAVLVPRLDAGSDSGVSATSCLVPRLVRRGGSSLVVCFATGALTLFFRVFLSHMLTSNPSCCRASFFVPVHVVLLWIVVNCPAGTTTARRVHDIASRCLQLSEYGLAVARSKMPQPRSIAPCPGSTVAEDHNTSRKSTLYMCGGGCVKNFVN